MTAARYRLRTPGSYLVVMAMVIGLSGALAALALTAPSRSATGGLLALALGLPLAALLATAPYRAWPGAAVTFTADAIVVQRGRRPRRFASDRVEVTAQQVNLRLTLALIPVGTVDRGQLITLRDDAGAARLSTLLIRPDDRAAFVADLQRGVRGESALGPDAQRPRPGPRTDDDDRLDAELRDLDR